MNEAQNAELASALVNEVIQHCPCGALNYAPAMFHRRSTQHDCVHHPRERCGHCRGVDRLIAGVEARLLVEVEHGPFVITRQERVA
jgi:hypothetical protein